MTRSNSRSLGGPPRTSDETASGIAWLYMNALYPLQYIDVQRVCRTVHAVSQHLRDRMIIHCSKLTTCRALGGGETIRLEFLDEGRNPVSLLLSFENAESIAMTLPGLLTQAVRAQTGQVDARYVFPLGQWQLEGAQDRQSFILTLTTADGFEVSFRVPQDTSRALGWTLQHEEYDEEEAAGSDDPDASLGKPEIN